MRNPFYLVDGQGRLKLQPNDDVVPYGRDHVYGQGHGPMQSLGGAVEGGQSGAGASMAVLDRRNVLDDPACRVHHTSYACPGLQRTASEGNSYLARTSNPKPTPLTPSPSLNPSPNPNPKPNCASPHHRHDERFEGAAGLTAFAYNSHLCSPSLKKEVDDLTSDGAAGACSVVIAARAMNKGAKKTTAAEDAAGQNTRPPSPPLRPYDYDLAHCSAVQPVTQGLSQSTPVERTSANMMRSSVDLRVAARGGTRGSPRAAGFAIEETDGGEHLHEEEVGFLLGQPTPSGRFAGHQRKVLGKGVAGAELRVSTCGPADLDAAYLSALAQGREMLDGGGCPASEPPRRNPTHDLRPDPGPIPVAYASSPGPP